MKRVLLCNAHSVIHFSFLWLHSSLKLNNVSMLQCFSTIWCGRHCRVESVELGFYFKGGECDKCLRNVVRWRILFFFLTKWDKTVTRVKQVVNYSFPNSFNLVCCYHILVTRVLSLLMCFLYVWMISKVQIFYRSPCTLMVVWYNCIKFMQNTSDTPEAAEQKETLKIHHRQDSQTLHSTIQMNQGQFGHISKYFTNTTE